MLLQTWPNVKILRNNIVKISWKISYFGPRSCIIVGQTMFFYCVIFLLWVIIGRDPYHSHTLLPWIFFMLRWSDAWFKELWCSLSPPSLQSNDLIDLSQKYGKSNGDLSIPGDRFIWSRYWSGLAIWQPIQSKVLLTSVIACCRCLLLQLHQSPYL